MSNFIIKLLYLVTLIVTFSSIGIGTIQNKVSANKFHFHTYKFYKYPRRRLLRKGVKIHNKYIKSHQYLRKHHRAILKEEYFDLLDDVCTVPAYKSKKSLRRSVKKIRGVTNQQRKYLFREINESHNTAIVGIISSLKKINKQAVKNHQKVLTRSQNEVIKRANKLNRKYKYDDVTDRLSYIENCIESTIFDNKHPGIEETS